MDAWHGKIGATVFVDSLRLIGAPADRVGEACRLFTLPGWLPDLHAFARKLRLLPGWYCRHDILPHYNLSPKRRRLALSLGAIEIGRRDLREVFRSWRHTRSQSVNMAVRWQLRLDSLAGDGLDAEGSPRPHRKARFLTPDEVAAEFAKAREVLSAASQLQTTSSRP